MKLRGILPFAGLVLATALAAAEAAPATPPLTVIKAGRVLDPQTGTTLANQAIVIEGEKVKTVGPPPRCSRACPPAPKSSTFAAPPSCPA